MALSFHLNPLVEIFVVACCSVTKLCLTLCDPTDCSTPGCPVLHGVLEFVQTHVHWVGDAIQPSHPLSLWPKCNLKTYMLAWKYNFKCERPCMSSLSPFWSTLLDTHTSIKCVIAKLFPYKYLVWTILLQEIFIMLLIIHVNIYMDIS